MCSCELPYGCWERKSGPLHEQQLLLTTELSLHPLVCILNSQPGKVAQSLGVLISSRDPTS